MIIPIFYATQTGNGIQISNLLCKNLNYLKIEDLEFKPIDISTVDINSIVSYNLIIIVVSTHGDGNFPFSISNFWTFLMFRGLPEKFFKDKKIAVFGLGDSSYDKFNYCSKILFNRLISLGSENIIERGDGDDQDYEGVYTQFNNWSSKLCSKILKLKNEKFEFQNFEETENEKKNNYKINVKEAKYLNLEKNILEFNFEMKLDDRIKYSPGDVIAITPKNYNTEEFCLYNKIDLGLKNFLESYDVNGVPDFNIFSDLKDYKNVKHDFKTPEEIKMCKTRLTQIFENYDDYFSYVKAVKRTFFEVLKDFNIRVDINFIKDNIPKIRKRFYTLPKINKDYKQNKQLKDEYSLLISLVDYKTIITEKRKGVCSEYFKTFINNPRECEVTYIKNELIFNKSKILIICTGAGISVARSIWQNIEDKEILIYYGFRNEDDKCYEYEYKSIKNIKLIECPSRTGEKKYVQDIFKENFKENILDYDVIVSGNTRLNKIFRELFLQKFSKEIKFQTETW